MTATESDAAPGVPSGLDLPEGLITPEALDDLRRITGLQMRPERYIREATIDTLNNFCNGIGDLNPLHRDEEYAKWTRYGGLLAPGCFLYARTWPGGTASACPACTASTAATTSASSARSASATASTASSACSASRRRRAASPASS